MIDCDVHVAPASMADLFPHLSDYWRQYVTEAGVTLNGLAPAYPPGAASTGGVAPATYDDLAARVLGPDGPAHVVLNCLTLFEIHRNPHYAAAIAAALNDWLVAEFLDRDPRLKASLVVSTSSPADAVAEVQRVEHAGFVQILLPVRADLPWGHKENHATFAAAHERGLQVGLHAWGRAGKAPTPSGFATTYLEDYLGNQAIAQAQVLSFVTEGVFAALPDLRVVLIECGFAWLAPLLWRFDKDWKGVWREVPWVQGRPSEHVYRHFRATTAPAHVPDDPRAVGQLLDMMDADGFLVYASDHPHDHGGGLDALLAALDDDGRRAVLHDNAAELYTLASSGGA